MKKCTIRLRLITVVRKLWKITTTTRSVGVGVVRATAARELVRRRTRTAGARQSDQPQER